MQWPLSPPPQALCPVFSHLPDILQLCSIHLHFPESKDCNWFLTLLPDVPFVPTQLPAHVNLLCRAMVKRREGAERGPSLGVWRPFSSIICIVVTLSLDKLFSLSFSQVSAVGSLSPRRSLYRTLSDESVCSNRKGSSYASSHSSMLDQAMPNDILFSSTPPYHSTLPPRMIHNQGASNLRSK